MKTGGNTHTKILRGRSTWSAPISCYFVAGIHPCIHSLSIHRKYIQKITKNSYSENVPVIVFDMENYHY